jgi:thiopeptide-type bacteriocin biosynthesis protein
LQVKDRHRVGPAYRQYARQLRMLLSDPAQALVSLPGGTEIQRILATRRQALAPLAARLGELDTSGRLSQQRSCLYASYLHMHYNRLLGLDRPAEEEVSALLLRTQQSLVAHSLPPANL